MKKKLIILSVLAALVFSAAGCGQTNGDDVQPTKKAEQTDASGAYEDGSVENGSSAGTTGDDVKYSENVDMDAVQGSEAKPQDNNKYEAEFGDAEVTIGDAKVIDYEGSSVAIVSFEYKNNADEPTPFTGVIVVEAYDESGNRLPQSAVSGVEGVDLLAMSENVPKGDTITVQRAFRLSDASQQFTIDVTAFDTSVSDLRLSKTFN